MKDDNDINPPSPVAADEWSGRGSTRVVPPADYWIHLKGEFPSSYLEQLRKISDDRVNEFAPGDLHPPSDSATDLLDRVASDGWAEKVTRYSCSDCGFGLTEEEASEQVCPECGEAFSSSGGVTTETAYSRNLPPRRIVDWVVAIHGMNTAGAWQESFSWYFSTSWGRSVPVAVYKYGKVIFGVVLSWRRRSLLKKLRKKLIVLRDEAEAKGFKGNPDVIAHSFGTWLFGHLLEEELKLKQKDRIRFGRIILTGCILRPDFNWKKMIKDEELVEAVLNHYGDNDRVVPWAHLTIRDSGPSGRRGFDGDGVINVLAAGCDHEDLLTIDKCVTGGRFHQSCVSKDSTTHLAYFYNRYWHQFLNLPEEELKEFPDRKNPVDTWEALPWPLRGTLFPFFVLPPILSVVALLIAGLGRGLIVGWKIFVASSVFCLAALAIIWVAVLTILNNRQKAKEKDREQIG